MATQSIPRHILVTGTPGVGKTTLIRRVCEKLQLSGFGIQGFYTEELRNQGRRIGFDVVTLDGKRGPLARAGGDEQPGQRKNTRRLGNYEVDIQQFELIALPALTSKSGNQPCIYVIDEIGKMELFSSNFTRTVRDVLKNSSHTTLATIPVVKHKPIPFVEEIRHDKDTVVFEITRENRDSMLEEVLQAVITSHKHHL